MSNEFEKSYIKNPVPHVLEYLNLQRERLWENFKISLVFLLPESAIEHVILQAPDFFDWRSGLFEFEDGYYINGTSEQINQLNKTEEELLSYIKLTKGWDGYQGVVPEESVINISLNFLKLIKSQNFPAPKPMLSGEGEVSLYWDIDNTYIEVGFEAESFFSYLIDSVDRTTGEDDVKFDSDTIPSNLLIELKELLKG